jgi:hypothetical protein
MVVQLCFGGAPTEREATMLKFIQTIVFGSAALIAVIATAPLTPAVAQGVPAGLLRLDPPRPTYYYNDDVRFTEAQQAKVRGAYASTRKNKRVR